MELSLTMIGLIGVGIFLLTLFLGMNVGIVMLISGVIGIVLIRGWDAALFTLGFTVYRTAASQFLVEFIACMEGLAGELLESGRAEAADRLVLVVDQAKEMAGLKVSLK